MSVDPKSIVTVEDLEYTKQTTDACIAPVESTSTASKAYAAGKRFWYTGKLYIATADIASGGTITPNTNCKLDVLGDDLTSQSEKIEEVYDIVIGENVVDTSFIKFTNNAAVTNNNDGTYTFGATDYGITRFGEPITLQPGNYKIPGIPYGYIYVGTDVNLTANPIAKNDTVNPIIFTVSSEQSNVLLGVRLLAKPAEAFTIKLYLGTVTLATLDSPSFSGIPKAPTAETGTLSNQLATTQFVGSSINTLGVPIATNAGAMQQIPADSDLDDYTTIGNYRVANSTIAITIVHRPSNNPGRLIVSHLAGTSNFMQIYAENGGSIYSRIKGAGDWSAWDRIATYAEMEESNESISRTSVATNGLYNVIKNLESAGTYNITFANAPVSFGLKNYVGNTQNVHPKVLYIENGFGGHTYWMAYTPYPGGHDRYENPCIAYSDNGLNWTNIDGNPLDDPQENGYNSDTHLVYYDGTLECWYRYVSDGDTRYETIYRQTSTNGVTWTAKQAVLTSTTAGAVHYLSPAVLFDGTTYQMWVVDNGTITYYEALASNITSWSKVRTYSLTFTDNGSASEAWHLDVIKDGSTYIMLVMCMVSNSPREKWSLFLCTSSDNETYTTPTKVLQGSQYSWDMFIYRSCIVKINTTYRIYYSAMTGATVCGLGLTASTSLSNFVGQLTI